MVFPQDFYEPGQEYTAVDSLQLLLLARLYCLAAVQDQTEKTNSSADILWLRSTHLLSTLVRWNYINTQHAVRM